MNVDCHHAVYPVSTYKKHFTTLLLVHASIIVKLPIQHEVIHFRWK